MLLFDKSIEFIAQKHAFYRKKAMLCVAFFAIIAPQNMLQALSMMRFLHKNSLLGILDGTLGNVMKNSRKTDFLRFLHSFCFQFVISFPFFPSSANQLLMSAALQAYPRS